MYLQSAVLLVCDEAVVNHRCERILATSGFARLTARDGRHGLDLYQLNRDRIALVVADASTPLMGGAELARRILEIDSDARIIITTGHGPGHPFPDDLQKSCIFLTKPFSEAEFRNAVNVAVDSDRKSEAATP